MFVKYIFMNTFLDYTGSKKNIKNKILSKFPKDYDLYVEPFVGSGTIFFELMPKKAILADLNSNLINTYFIVKTNVNELISKLKRIYKAYQNAYDPKEYYMQKRKRYNKIKYYNNAKLNSKSLKIRIEIATLFIFINKTCYRALYRENRKGEFNVSLGNRSKNIINNQYFELLHKISKMFKSKGIRIYHGDYKTILKKIKPNTKTIIYIDPPYYPCNDFKFEYTDTFGIKEQQELADIINNLDKNPQNYIYLSNSYCRPVTKLYPNMKKTKINLRRIISPKDKNNFSEYLIYSK